MKPEERAQHLYALARDPGTNDEERRTAAMAFVRHIEQHKIPIGKPGEAVDDSARTEIDRLIRAFWNAPAELGPAPHPLSCEGCDGRIVMHELCYLKGPVAWHRGCYR